MMLCLATLHLGCGNSEESARKELAKLNKDFSPAVFMNCIRDGDNLAVKLFIRAGMDVNKPESSNFTPLMIAAWNGNLDGAKLLLNRGADLNAAMADGRTAIQIANSRQHAELAKMLAGNLPKNFFIGTWVQHGELAASTWEFRSDGTYSCQLEYNNHTSETLTGPYQLRQPHGSVSGPILECSFEEKEQRKMFLRIVDDRLFEVNSDLDMTTDNPGAWLHRK